jgi:hypothetical protein
MLSVVLLACRSTIPTPRTGTPPAGARVYLDVPYPPPAAQVEVIPALPREGAVWVDGQWTWQGKRWIWDSGGWVMPPANSYFAPWLTYRQADGRLLFSGGSWHSDDGRPIVRPAFLAMAMSAPSASSPPVSSPSAPPASSAR